MKKAEFELQLSIQIRWNVYLWQVETVGDKYMTVSGLPEPCTHHAKSICHLALDMMEIAGQVKVDEEPVQVAAPYTVWQMEMFGWCK